MSTAPITSLVQIGNRTRVQVGSLVGEVTTASVERLELRNGDAVVASFKAAATRLVPRELAARQLTRELAEDRGVQVDVALRSSPETSEPCCETASGGCRG